jgi:hypothetical protein
LQARRRLLLPIYPVRLTSNVIRAPTIAHQMYAGRLVVI